MPLSCIRKAILYGARDLRFVNEPVPEELGPHQVLVRTLVTALSTGTDLANYDGRSEEQIEVMRKKVLELIVSGASKMSTSSREKELIEMVRFVSYLFCDWQLTLSKVIRLTSAHTPDVAQLYTQAKTIQELCRQRDFIIKEVAEERARWEAERQGFDRVTEALIAGRSHGGDSTYREEVCLLSLVDNANDIDPRFQELERQVATLDADNKALRQKVTFSP